MPLFSMCLKGVTWLAGLILIACNACAEPDLPARTSHVNDFAETLSPAVRTSLNDVLRKLEEETTDQILVATFSSYGDETMESFAGRLSNSWKLGHKDKGNGVILVIFQKEHQAWLEVGTGLNAKLPFNFRRKIIRDVIGPYFRARQYDEGIYEAVTAIIHKLYPLFAVPRLNQSAIANWKMIGIIFMTILAMLFIIDLSIYGKYRHDEKSTSTVKNYDPIGTYSFLEWWLLYGILPGINSFVYFHILIRWTNPSCLISGKGPKSPFPNLATGRGRFSGIGISGKW